MNFVPSTVNIYKCGSFKCVPRESKRFPFNENIAKKVGKVTQELAAASGVPQAIRTVLYVSASPQVPAACRRNCTIELRCGAVRRVIRSSCGMVETTRNTNISSLAIR